MSFLTRILSCSKIDALIWRIIIRYWSSWKSFIFVSVVDDSESFNLWRACIWSSMMLIARCCTIINMSWFTSRNCMIEIWWKWIWNFYNDTQNLNRVTQTHFNINVWVIHFRFYYAQVVSEIQCYSSTMRKWAEDT